MIWRNWATGTNPWCLTATPKEPMAVALSLRKELQCKIYKEVSATFVGGEGEFLGIVDFEHETGRTTPRTESLQAGRILRKLEWVWDTAEGQHRLPQGVDQFAVLAEFLIAL